MKTRQQFLDAVADAHEQWALKHGDTAPYVEADSDPHAGPDGETDYPIHHLDRSAPPEIDDELGMILLALIEEGYTDDQPAEAQAP